MKETRCKINVGIFFSTRGVKTVWSEPSIGGNWFRWVSLNFCKDSGRQQWNSTTPMTFEEGGRFFSTFLFPSLSPCVCVCLSPSICNENRRQTRTRNGKETSTGWNLRPNSFLFQDVNTHTHRTEKNNRIKQICSTSFHTWNQSIRRICHRLEFQIISLPFPHR